MILNKCVSNIDKNMIMNWHRSAFSLINNDGLLEDVLWIDTNIKGKWYSPVVYEWHQTNIMNLIYFELKEDLVLFTLSRKFN